MPSETDEGETFSRMYGAAKMNDASAANVSPYRAFRQRRE